MPVNFVSNFSEKPVEPRKTDTRNSNQNVLSKLSIRDAVIITAVPTVIGSGYAAKTYFECNAKLSVYKDMLKKFEGTAFHDNFKDCVNLMEKSMSKAKKCGILTMVAGIISAGAFAVVKTIKSYSNRHKENNSPQKTIEEITLEDSAAK